MKVGKSAYLMRLILLCLGIGAFPVLALGGFSYFQLSSGMQRLADEANAHLLAMTKVRIEQHLRSIDDAVNQFIGSQYFNQTMEGMLGPQQFERAQELFKAIGAMQRPEMFFRSFTIVNTEYQWVLDERGISRLTREDEVRYLPFFKEVDGPSQWQASTEHRARLVKKHPFHSGKPVNFIIAEVSLLEISRMIAAESNAGEIAILDEKGQLLLHSVEPGSTPRLQPSMIHDIVANGASDSWRTHRTGDKETGVVSDRSAYNGWYYISLVPLEEMTRRSREVGVLTLLISGAILLVTVFIAIGGSRSVYSPIGRLYSSIFGVHHGKRTRVDELAAISERFLTLMSSHEQLSKRLKEHFVAKLIQGSVQPRDIEERQQSGEIPVFPAYAVLVLDIDTLEGTRYQDKDKDLLLYAVNNMASELIPAAERLEPILHEQAQVTIVGIGEDGHSEDGVSGLLQQAQLVRKQVKELLGLPVSIGISSPYQELRNTVWAYKEGHEALQYRKRFGGNTVLYYGYVHPGDKSGKHYPAKLEEELLEAVKLADEQRARQLLHEFVQELVQNETHYQEFEFGLVRLLLSLLKLVPDQDQMKLELDSKSLLDRLSGLKTPDEMERWLCEEIAGPVMKALESRDELQYKVITQRMIQLIEENCQLDLTLEQCAAKMNYHPSYLKRVFVKATGQSFTDYVQLRRLEQAKKLLVETEKRIGDIAAEFGYTNPQNFIRYFRKLVGVTPKQYRDENRRLL